jgi:hypothetical protein
MHASFFSDPKRRSAALLIMMGAVGVAGCSSVPPAAPQLARAAQQIEEAQQAGAAEFAAVELQSASKNLREAQAKEATGDDREAMTLAKRAELDATLAESKARAGQAAKSAETVQSGTEALRQEADRTLQANPPARPATPNQSMPVGKEAP